MPSTDALADSLRYEIPLEGGYEKVEGFLSVTISGSATVSVATRERDARSPGFSSLDDLFIRSGCLSRRLRDVY
jgi:hypothetical protein